MATKRTVQQTTASHDDLPIPYVDLDALMRIQRSNFDVMVEANRIFVEAAQAIACCQSDMMRDYVEHMTRAFAELTGNAEPGEKAARETAVAQQLFEKTAGHVRQIAELIGRSNAETIGLMNGRVRAAIEDVRPAGRTKAGTVAAE